MRKDNGEDKTLKEALSKLLSAGSATSQETLKQQLQDQGFIINQSKISRLLRKMGAIKIVSPTGESIYRLPLEPDPPRSDLAISQLVLEIVHNEFLIIVRTSPGCASLIARVLDFQAKDLAILGTVAGDDTIFVAPLSVSSIKSTFQEIKKALL